MAPTLASGIVLTAELIADHPEDEDELLVTVISQSGFDRALGERLVTFVPLAFGRVYLAEARPTFPLEYIIRDLRSDRSVRRAFSSEPVFEAALAIARSWTTESRDKVARVAHRSAEVRVVQQLTTPGGSPAAIVLTEPILTRIPFPDTEEKRPWWKLW